MKLGDMLICGLKIVGTVGIVVWNAVRLVQTRHCLLRKEACENENCKWWNFCDKHGNSLFMDIY